MKITKLPEPKPGCSCIECQQTTKLTRLSFGDGKLAFYLCPGCLKALRFTSEEDSHERQRRVKDALKEIDAADHDVTTWEANFLESVLAGGGRSGGAYLSERQLESAERMITKYIK